jgi:hypothetical protein
MPAIVPFECCNALPAIHHEHGVEMCYECDAHRDDCGCSECESDRALDEDADMSREYLDA